MRLLASTRFALACALALVTACSGGDDGGDPDPDVPDATIPDARPGVPPDGGPGVPPDGGPGVPPDGGPGVPPDGGPGVPPDGGPGVPPDGGAESPPDGGPGVPPDGGAESPPDGGIAVPPDAGAEVPPDAAPEVPPDAALPAPAFVLSTATLAVRERDATGAAVAVSLTAAPGRTVEVTITSADPAVTATPATLTFDDASFQTGQQVQITAGDDLDVADEAVAVTFSAAGLDDATVTVSVDDDDTQTIVTSAAAVTAREGGSATFTVRLSNDPSGVLALAVASSDAGAAAASPATLTFDAGNFATPQTVTVTGVDDIDLVDGSAAVTVSGAGVAAVEVAVSVDDDDVQTILASAASVAVAEGGSATFTVRLSNQPPSPVQVAVRSSDAAAAAAAPATLAFDAGNFAQPQTVTVTGLADDDTAGASATVTLVGAGVVIPVAVAVTDTTQPYPVDMFVRGGFNGFELDDALVFEGNARYGARVPLPTDVHPFKIADAAFSFERTFSIRQDSEVAIALDTPTPLQRTIGEFNNTVLLADTPGIYRFDLEASDPVAPVLTVSLDEPATYFRDMYVRGSFGAFEAVDRMAYEGGGRHTALVSLSQGVHEFKISDALFSNDTTFSVSAAGLAAIALDTPTPLEPAAGPFNNTALTIVQPGVYLFDMDASDPAAPVLTVSLVEAAPFAGNVYVRAGFNGFGLGNELRYEGGGRYGALVTLTQDTHAFKVADALFSPGATFSADAATPVVIGLAQPTPLRPVRPEDSDTLLTIAEAGIYRFALDARDPGAPVLTVTLFQAAPLAMDLYVRGSFNGFGVLDPLVFLGAFDYEARIELAAGTHAFKIADDAFTPGLTFSADTFVPVEITLEVPAQFGVAPGEANNTLITVPQAGTYVFEVRVLSLTSLRVTVRPAPPADAPPDAPPDVPADVPPDVPGVAGASWLAAWLAAFLR
jgi:hypothetical protein